MIWQLLVAQQLKNGLTLTINGTGLYVLTATNWTSDIEVFTLSATYNGITLEKLFKISKAKQGIQGIQGLAGSDGNDGQTPYLHIAYANSSDGSTDFSTTVYTDKIFIGQYVDFTEEDSSNYQDYKWTKIQGPIGPAGEDGSDGQSMYIHIAYATNSTGSAGFSLTYTGVETYIGTYTDTIEEDSNNANMYNWALFKGTDGEDGVNGTSVVLKGSVQSILNLPTGAAVGDLYVVLDDGDGYVWNGSSWDNIGQIQGPAGADGEDGAAAYIHYAYATSADGQTNFNVNPFDGATYIGIYTDFTQADSTSYSDYDWSLFRGADGVNGINGLSAYIHYAYATSADGQTNFSTTYFDGASYIGMYTDFTQADSTSYSDYDWALFKGSDGLDGEDGENGLPAYLHFAYSTVADGSVNFSLAYTGVESYIGTYTDNTLADSTSYLDYNWALFKGADGEDGTNAQYVIVTGPQSFKFLTGQTIPEETSITLSAELFGGLSNYDWEYWNGSLWLDLSGTQNQQTYTLAYDNSAWSTNDLLRVRCISDTVYDEITIIKLYDGSVGPQGQNALNAYLTNENITVTSESDGTGYSLTSATGTFKVFYGLTDVTTSAVFSGGSTKNGLTLAINTSGVYSLSGAT